MKQNHQHTAGDRTPYTYVVLFPSLNQLYYGVRYARNCHPSELGVDYKSSSRHVKRLLQIHFDAVFIVRRIFNSIEEATAWETKVLKRMNAARHPSFLNKQNNCLFPIDNRGSNNPMFGLPGTMLGKTGWNKGLTKFTDERLAKHAQSCSIAQKGRKRVEFFSSKSGSVGLRFTGYYHTPWGMFATSRLAATADLAHNVILGACKNPDKKITKRTKNQFFRKFIGKTFREIGFWFEPV